MRRRTWTTCLAFTSLKSTCYAFAPIPVTHISRIEATKLNAFTPESIDTTHHILHSASTLLSTIDSDIANIPDNEFRKVFAGGGIIMLGSILSTVFVGYLIESNNSYADLVAETYTGQEKEESFLDSLSFEQRKEAEDMVYDFREKKAKRAGTWTEEDERLKTERLSRDNRVEDSVIEVKKEKDAFSDY